MPGEALAADVGQVGHRGLEVVLEFVGQRHRPAVLADLLRDRGDAVAELVAAHHPGRAGAQRDGLRAGQRRRLDQVVGLVLAGPHDRVGQDQPALGVGVEHLDGDAAVLGQHVAGALRGRRRHVLGHRHGGDHVDRQPQLRGQHHGRDDGGGPAHVRGHVVHDAAGLIEMPPVSKVMPLPTSATFLAFLACLGAAANRGGSAAPAAAAATSPARRRSPRRSRPSPAPCRRAPRPRGRRIRPKPLRAWRIRRGTGGWAGC